MANATGVIFSSVTHVGNAVIMSSQGLTDIAIKNNNRCIAQTIQIYSTACELGVAHLLQRYQTVLEKGYIDVL